MIKCRALLINCRAFDTSSIRLVCLLIVFLTPLTTASADNTVIRIGTGGTAGTYFPIGSLIADALSGNSELHLGKSYNIPDMLAIAQRAPGSESNVLDLNEGLLEAGLAQANVVHWAYNASGPFADEEPMLALRGLATLYLESMHLVARKGSGITNVGDLEGRTVSLDEQGSGTLLDSLVLLKQFGLTSDNIDMVYLKTTDAIDRLENNEIDAFFVVAGYPIQRVSQLIEDELATVIPISGPNIDKFLFDHPFLSADTIPAGTYNNETDTMTIGVPAQLILNKDVDSDLAYNLTNMLWSDETLSFISAGHPKGHEVKLESALTRMNVPLHPGAKRFYVEKGLIQP